MDEHRAGERLSAARERAGLTEEQVAERVGLPVASYRDLEHDRGELFSNVSLRREQIPQRTLSNDALQLASTPKHCG
jgi:transcriptional regulator with XRE-family HTH domain